MKIRVARFRDRAGADFTGEFAKWSTGGKWHYITWVEAGPWSLGLWSHRSRWNIGSKSFKRVIQCLRYSPEIHEYEVWSRPITAHPSINRMAHGVAALSEGAAKLFIEEIKRLVAQGFAIGRDDNNRVDGSLYLFPAGYNPEDPEFPYKIVPLFG